MDREFELKGIRFVWNDEKAKQNEQKHGVTFKEASEVFFDPFLKVIDASQNFEERDGVIGFTERWELLRVICIETQAEAIRIISARNATKQVRKDYEDG
jgi:uncharacterized DUF497 family protein